MTTLYELLGALPDDDAEGLRTAFRKAAKLTHPDTNPDDPDASQRFRQLVRAHDILSDAEQRAAYDQLLELAQSAPGSKSRHTIIYERVHKLASNTLAATVISGVLVGSYTLLVPASEAPGIPEKIIEFVTRQPVEVAALTPTVQSDAVARDEIRETPKATANEVLTTGTVWPKGGVEPIANIDPVTMLAAKDAKSYRTRGISAYRNGDLYRALADFDLAIQHNPNYAEAYVDRGIVLYRMRQFDRAYADMAKAKQIGSGKPTKTAALTAAPPQRKTSPVTVGNALNVAASDRFLDVPAQTIRSERR